MQRLAVECRVTRDRPAVIEYGAGGLNGRELRPLLRLHPGVALEPLQPGVEGLQVGEDQLGVDRRDVVGRLDLAVDVRDVRVVERPHDLADRVRLADVGEELVAEALPLTRPADDAGNVDERDRGRHDLCAVEHLARARRAGRPAR